MLLKHSFDRNTFDIFRQMVQQIFACGAETNRLASADQTSNILTEMACEKCGIRSIPIW